MSERAHLKELIGSGTLQGRRIAAEFAQKGYFDNNSQRMSPDLVDDLVKLDVYRRSGAFTRPVRIIHGDRDDVAPVSQVRTYLEHYNGNAVLEVVAGADHAWGTVLHRTQLRQSTLESFVEHFRCLKGPCPAPVRVPAF
ncbi:hypothetical protein [Streptomyces sp. NPDC060065]|uniref:hypothetical protein n=1 Tax=Streptomyces sp. NPDC060065 TaxID=3347050 RepID=UPI00369C72DB